MSKAVLSCVDPQVRVTVSHADRPAALRADRDLPPPTHPTASAKAVPPASPSAPFAGGEEGPGEVRGVRFGRTHGLHSREAVIDGESAADLDAYRAEMEAALQPHDRPERDLVEVIVMSQWKLRRLWRQETRIYFHWQGELDGKDPHGTYGVINDCRQDQAFTRLSRVEAHLTRAYLRAESRLRLLQDLRRKGLRGADEEVAQTAQAVPPSSPPVVTGGEEGQGELRRVQSEPQPPPLPIPPTHGDDTAIRENTNRPALAESIKPGAQHGAPGTDTPQPPLVTGDPEPSPWADTPIQEIPNRLADAAD